MVARFPYTDNGFESLVRLDPGSSGDCDFHLLPFSGSAFSRRGVARTHLARRVTFWLQRRAV